MEDDFLARLLAAPISRRRFMKTSAALASAAANPTMALSKTHLAAMQAAIGPLAQVLRSAAAADSAIRTISPKRRSWNTVDPSASAAADALQQVMSLTRATQQLLRDHPAAQEVIDGLSAADPEFHMDMTIRVARFVSDNASWFDEEQRKAAQTILIDGRTLNDEEINRCRSILSEALRQSWSKDSGNDSSPRSFVDDLIPLIQRKNELQCRFLESLGLSQITPSASDSRRSPVIKGNACTSLTLHKSSPAEEFRATLTGIKHLPVKDLKLLSNPQLLIQKLFEEVPSLRPCQNSRLQAKSRIKPNKAAPAASNGPLQPPQTVTNVMTEKEFAYAYAEDPSVVTALGRGTHAEKIARALGVTLEK